MKLQDFNTLAEAQAYQVTEGRLISPDMMVAFLTKFHVLGSVMNATTDEALGLQTALQFGSEFNLIKDHPASISDLLAQMISDGLATELLKPQLEAYANPVTFPFASATQDEFDQAKLTGTSIVNVVYEGGDKLVTVGKTYFSLAATLTEPAPKDITVKCKYKMSKGAGLPYLPVSREHHFTIPKGEQGFIEANIPLKAMHRWVQFEATIDVANTDCTVEVTGV